MAARPEEANSITDEQRDQIHQLVAAVACQDPACVEAVERCWRHAGECTGCRHASAGSCRTRGKKLQQINEGDDGNVAMIAPDGRVHSRCPLDKVAELEKGRREETLMAQDPFAAFVAKDDPFAAYRR